MKALTIISIVLELLLLVGGLIEFGVGLLVGDPTLKSGGQLLVLTGAVLMLLRRQRERDEKDA